MIFYLVAAILNTQHSTLNTQHSTLNNTCPCPKNIGQPYIVEKIEIMATRDLFTTRLSITDTNENNNSTTRCE